MAFSKTIRLALVLLICMLLPAIAACGESETVDGVTYDSNNWVISCDGDVTSVTLRDGTVGIKSGAFSGCTALNEIYIPDSVTTIMKNAFKGCDALLKQENGISYVNGWVIDADTTITVASLPSGTVGIADEAFHGCTALKTFSAPSDLENIGDLAFFGCESLEEITIPFIGSSKSSTFDSHIGYLFGAGSADKNDSYTPASLKKITLTDATSVADDAFRACDSIVEVILPDSVTYIGDSAFRGCTSLKKVEMSASVTEIGAHAFRLCSSLSEITIPSGVTAINPFCFTECISLKEVVIPDSVTEIKACAFGLCGNIETLILSKNLTSIGQEAFRGCSYITDVTVASGKIGVGAFYECQNLRTATLGDDVTEIGDNAFSLCGSLTTISEPALLTKIGSEAFFYCLSITSFDIPEGVTSIGSKAFYYCTSLSNVTIPNSVEKIGSDAFNNCNRALYSEADEITVVDGWVTYARPSITSIVIDESIRGIADSVFAKTKNLSAVYCSSANIWDNINVGEMNSNIFSTKTYVYSEGHPEANGNYWHYVDGIPTVW